MAMPLSAKCGIVILAVIAIALAAVAIAVKGGKASSLSLILACFLAILLIPPIIGACWQVSAQKCVTVLLAESFIVIVTLSFYGMLKREVDRTPIPHFKEVEKKPKTAHSTLFVLVHGIDAGSQPWKTVKPVLLEEGDVLSTDYDSDMLSNADPDLLAGEISAYVQRKSAGYNKIILIGHSIGSLIARKAYLIGDCKPIVNSNQCKAAENTGEQTTQSAEEKWTEKVDRLILLAGLNRGWDISGRKPMDMSLGRRVLFWFGAWFGRLTKTGALILSIETGAPFVSDLRLEWMQHFREAQVRKPIVVQMLGDIDDMVSSEDDKDLRAAAMTGRSDHAQEPPTAAENKFFWLKVRGTDHANIVDLPDAENEQHEPDPIEEYRRQKLLFAVRASPTKLAAENEEQPYTTDNSVNHIIFILHGIRDLGEWSSKFEQELRPELKSPDKPPTDGLAIVSPRYGYFGMGQFLFRPDRQKFVRWFMDQYTETLARYPKASTIDFIGHSNGTYLFKGAFDKYSQIRFNRVVFAGSVIPQSFNWVKLADEKRVEKLRNYQGTTDWVVGLFPRLFELPYLRHVNDMGTAGFNGFTELPEDRRNFANVTIAGGHSAFQDVIPDIAAFVTGKDTTANIASMAETSCVAKLLFNWGFVFVWLLLTALILIPLVRVAQAAGVYAWVPIAAYLSILFLLLKRL